MKREKNREMKKALLIELPAMLVIGAGMFAWAFLLWAVAP